MRKTVYYLILLILPCGFLGCANTLSTISGTASGCGNAIKGIGEGISNDVKHD